MRSARAHLHALLIGSLALVSVLVADRAQYFCKVMERALAECCCASHGNSARSEAATASAPSCCERLKSRAGQVASAARDAAPLVLSASLLSLPTELEWPAQTFRLLPAGAAGARAPPALGPPLFLAHCSLLI